MTSSQKLPRPGIHKPQGEQWLFRQGALVLGPMSKEQIIERLYAGSLDGSTEITPLGQNQYRPLAELDLFKIDLAKAQADLVAAERDFRRDRRLGSGERGAIFGGTYPLQDRPGGGDFRRAADHRPRQSACCLRRIGGLPTLERRSQPPKNGDPALNRS